PAIAELLPRARGAHVERFVVTREHAATFRAAPGVAALRPGPRTAVPGLVLAGAWTDTGWPATMEGAVRSGHAAARGALAGARAGAPASWSWPRRSGARRGAASARGPRPSPAPSSAGAWPPAAVRSSRSARGPGPPPAPTAPWRSTPSRPGWRAAPPTVR